MTPCLGEHLEAWVTGRLPGAEADAVQAHLRKCAACAREAAWLRAERSLVREHARATAPSPVRRGQLKRSLEARLTRAEHASRRRHLVTAALRWAGSFSVAVLVAFVAANVRLPEHPVADFDGFGCVSIDGSVRCTAPGEVDHSIDLVALVESSYDACLVATPRSLPGVSDLCL